MAVTHFREFTLRGEIGITQFLSLARPNLRLVAEAPYAFTRTWLDRFDWGLLHRDVEFWADQINGGCRLHLKSPRREISSPMPGDCLPAWADDCPDEDLSAALRPLLELRILQPRLTMQGMRHDFTSQAESDGIRICVERFHLDEPDDRMPLIRLTIAAPKGQVKPFRRACELADATLTVERISGPLLRHLLDEHDISSEDPSRLRAGDFAPDERADAAAKCLLRGLLANCLANEQGVVERWDTEFLHDYRVALRRIRTLLRQFQSAFPATTVDRYSREFARLASITGEARDWDVFLLNLRELRALTPELLVSELELLAALAQAYDEAAHARLREYFAAPDHRGLIADWRAFLDTPVPKRPSAPDARLPVRVLADRRILKLHERLARSCKAMTAESPPEGIHELRKTGKKLRYLLELFRHLYPAERIDPMLKSLRELQENLGSFQDLQVQIAHLQSAAEELRRAHVPSSTLLAVGALISRLREDEQRARIAAVDSSRAFAANDRQRRFRRWLRASP